MDTIYDSLERVHDALYNFRGVDVYRIEDWRIHLRRYGERYVMLSIGTGEEGVEWSDLFSTYYTGFTEELIEWSRQRVEELEREMRMMRALGYRERWYPIYWAREYDGGFIRVRRSRYHIEIERLRGTVEDTSVVVEDRRHYMSSRRIWRCMVEFEKRGSTIESTSSMTPLLRECVVSSRYLRELEKR